MDNNYTPKRNVSGWFILTIVVFSAAFEIILGLISNITGTALDLTMLWFVRSGILFGIALLFMLPSGLKFSDFFGFKRIKISVIFLTLLFGILVFPFATLISSVSNLLFGNPLVTFTAETDIGFFLIMAVIIAPFIEEIFFRGILFRDLRRRGRILLPIMINSVMFGLFHGNITQFIYATVLGIFLSLIVDAGGSLWCSIIIHAEFNALGTIIPLLFNLSAVALSADISPLPYPEADVLSPAVTIASYITGFVFFLALSVFLLWLAFKVLRAIARIQGRHDIYRKRTYPKRLASGSAYVYIPLIIALVLSSTLVSLNFLSMVFG